MVRQKRIAAKSGIYHVVSRGSGRQIIFEDDVDRKKYLDVLKENLVKYDASLYAWCLMGNHTHLIISSSLEDLSKLMRHLNSSYSMFFNKRHGRIGHLMQGRFKSEPINDEAYLLTAIRYVHKNPEKAKIAPTETYPWSSFQELVGKNVELGLSNVSWVLDLFSGKEGFLKFHAKDDLSAPCIDVERGRKLLPDDEAIIVARAVLTDCSLEEVPGFSKKDRDNAIRKLRAANLSVRQIERLTGVSRSIVSNIR